MSYLLKAPVLEVSEWINTPVPLSLANSLAELKGRVVVIHAFQLLCPGCVSHGIPQAIKIHNAFQREDLMVLGLHTVFEHHAAMQSDVLKAFIQQYRIPFPVGVDVARRGNNIPTTMHAFNLQGTPSLIVIDRKGQMQLSHFGHASDLLVGALIGRLIAEDV